MDSSASRESTVRPVAVTLPSGSADLIDLSTGTRIDPRDLESSFKKRILFSNSSFEFGFEYIDVQLSHRT